MKRIANDCFLFKTLIIKCLLLLSLLLFSCSKDVQINENGEFGVLDIGIESVVIDHNISVLQTKSVAIPNINDFSLKIKNNNSLVYECNGGVNDYVIGIGNYTAEVAYGADYISNDNLLFSLQPYFYATSDFAVSVANKTSLTLTPKFRGSVIVVNVSADLLSHYNSYGLILNGGYNGIPFTTNITNAAQLFLKPGVEASVTLSGVNKVGENISSVIFNSSSLTGGVLADCTEYVVNVNPSLPIITLPSQLDYNSWATSHTITPAVVANSSNSAAIEQGLLYKASYDNWVTSYTGSVVDGILKFSGLPKNELSSTIYSMKAIYGGLESNEVSFVTERAQQIENGDFESYTTSKDMTLYGNRGHMYCYNFGVWSSLNDKTTNGAQNVSISNTNAVKWKYCSGTEPIENNGNKMIRVRTLAFYNSSVGASIWTNSDNDGFGNYSIIKWVRSDGTAHIGKLFTGTYDISSDVINSKISFQSRPKQLELEYKYIPVNGDNALIYCELYDINNSLIADTGSKTFGEKTEFSKVVLNLNYTDLLSKVSYITVFFQSGVDIDKNKMHLDDGSGSSPKSTSCVIGSELTIDNIKLIY